MRLCTGVGLLALTLLTSAFHSTWAESELEAALPLPELSLEDIAVPNWPGERPLANSVRACHYNPKLVRPLLEVSGAVEDTTLSFAMRSMLAAVVASRNHCLY